MQINANEIHIWTISLTLFHEQEQQAFACLSTDEKERALRLRFPIHQQRFIAARATLRQLLGLYLDIAAKEIIFGYSEHKKPYLLSPERSVLQFNVSHSHDSAIYAFGLNHVLGIDIEKVTNHDHYDLAQRYFSPQEKSELKALPDSEKKMAFYRLWTRKEALLKALGSGLSLPLASFSVSHQEIVQDISLGKEVWQLVPLSVDTDYQAALAIKPGIHILSYWNFFNHQPQLQKVYKF